MSPWSTVCAALWHAAFPNLIYQLFSIVVTRLFYIMINPSVKNNAHVDLCKSQPHTPISTYFTKFCHNRFRSNIFTTHRKTNTPHALSFSNEFYHNSKLQEIPIKTWQTHIGLRCTWVDVTVRNNWLQNRRPVFDSWQKQVHWLKKSSGIHAALYPVGDSEIYRSMKQPALIDANLTLIRLQFHDSVKKTMNHEL